MADRVFEPAMTRHLKKGQQEPASARPAKIIVAPGKIDIVAHDNKFPTICIKTTDVMKPKMTKSTTPWIVLDFVSKVDAKFVYINFQPVDSSKMTVLLDVLLHAWSSLNPRASGIFTDSVEDLPMLPVFIRPPNAKPVPPTVAPAGRSVRQAIVCVSEGGAAANPQFSSDFNRSSSNQPKKQTTVQLQGYFDEYGLTNKSTGEQQKAVHKNPAAAKTHASTSGQQTKTAPLFSQKALRIEKIYSLVDNRNDGIEGSSYSKPAPVTRTTPLSAARSGTKDSLVKRTLPLRELAMQPPPLIDCDPEGGAAFNPQFSSDFNRSSSNQSQKRTAWELEESVEEKRLRRFFADDSNIESVHDVKTTSLGVEHSRFKAKIDFDGRSITRAYLKEEADTGMMLREAQSLQTTTQLEEFMEKHGEKIIDRVTEVVDRIVGEVTKKHKDIRHVDLEAL